MKPGGLCLSVLSFKSVGHCASALLVSQLIKWHLWMGLYNMNVANVKMLVVQASTQPRVQPQLKQLDGDDDEPCVFAGSHVILVMQKDDSQFDVSLSCTVDSQFACT